MNHLKRVPNLQTRAAQITSIRVDRRHTRGGTRKTKHIKCNDAKIVFIDSAVWAMVLERANM